MTKAATRRPRRVRLVLKRPNERCDGPARRSNPRRARPPRMDEEKKSPRDIAKMNAKEYREPGRDLQATKPAPQGGDEDNPCARERTHGAGGDAPLGSDERARLEKRRS